VATLYRIEWQLCTGLGGRIHWNTQDDRDISVNATIAPLVNIKKELIGSMLVLEDITSEKRIKSTFGRYLSKEVVDELLSSPTGLQLGGELREVTFLVSDLRGFTSMSSRLPPQDIISILNRYLERMVDIIADYRGTVDEFQGDGILAFFGAPLSANDDPERAIACAIAMQKALVELNDEQRQRQMPELVMGIGINTGEVIVGNIGSEKRAKYGAVGSAINTAYRIESYTVGGQVLVSPSTYERVRSLVRLRGTLEVEFKGLDKPMTLYDVVGLDGSYHLDLPETDSVTFTALAAPLSIDCFPVQGKTVADTAIAGQITHLAASAAEAVLAAPAALLTNLKIVLTSPEARGLSEVYAKVLSLDTAGVESVITKAHLEFTSLPDDAKTFLAQYLVD
jgi:adenylate cyclase